MATILVIDDHPVNRDYLNTLLGYSGYRVLVAADGECGLSLAAAHQPDLIVCDMLMPSMDGYEFVRRLRTRSEIAATPIIFYTAHFLTEDAEELARAIGVTQIVPKACDPQVVLDAVSLALGQKPASAPVPEEFDREHLRLVTDQLHQQVEKMRTLNLRLSAILELGGQLASENDPERLLASYCRAARDLIGSSCAGIGLVDGAGHIDRRLFASGEQPEQARQVFQIAEVAELCSEVASQGHTLRSCLPHSVAGPADGARSFLGAPIRSPSRAYGWLCLINKLGAEEFSLEDERLAVTFAAQVGVAFENARRFDEIQHYLSRLETEMQERSRVEEELLRYRDHLEALVAERTRQLEASHENLRRSERLASIGTLAAGIAHEINNPLNAILMSAQYIMSTYADLPAEVRETFHIIVQESKRCGKIVRGVLQFARQRDTKKAPANLNEIILQGVDLSQSYSRNEGLQVELQLAESLPEVALNATEIEQVLINLLQNAAQAKDAPCHVVIRTQRTTSGVRLILEDDGPGIADEHLNHIFDPFYSTRQHKGGTGLGLSMVHGIVASHGGSIDVKTQLGKGTAFIIDLPPHAGNGTGLCEGSLTLSA